MAKETGWIRERPGSGATLKEWVIQCAYEGLTVSLIVYNSSLP